VGIGILRLRIHFLKIIFCGCLLAGPGAVPAAIGTETERKQIDGEDSLDRELSELGGENYPDLVSADESDELMDEFAFLEESDVVDSAARHRQEIGMSPSAITVITREDIEASGANTLADLLRLVPGMDVAVASTYVTGITSRLYWTYENNHYLVLVDGREANIELFGQSAFELQPIELEDIQRIEVIRGPGSSLYGANAVAGVVSITTRAVPEKTSGWVRMSGGESAIFIVGARASTRIGNWGFSLSGGGNVGGLFSNPRISGKEVWKLRSVVEYRFSEKRRLLLDAGATSSTGYTPAVAGDIVGNYPMGTLRLAYESEDLRGHLYWTHTPWDARLEAPLDYGGVRLARFAPFEVTGHTIVGEVQWTLPTLFEQLLLIVGGGGRVSLVDSDQLLDAETYSDITSNRYHQAGIEHFEARTGAFVHGELAPVDWVTVTGGVRFDYNTVTGTFWSPRLAAVFKPAAGHFIRLGLARAFRKPAFMETHIHLMADFPPDSPITGPDREKFQEFMTRIVGNPDLENEKLISFEVGYMGQFLEDRLVVSLDLYYNLHTDQIVFGTSIIPNEQGLPDLDLSSVKFDNIAPDIYVIGSELRVRFDLSKTVAFTASWAHREVFDLESGRNSDESPKNLITLGARFRTSFGLLGSLYAFSRSRFWDMTVPTPAGMMEDLLAMHLDDSMLLLSKLAWRWEVPEIVGLEAGVKLFLPVNLSDLTVGYYEAGGGISPTGKRYGGEELNRVVIGYLQGSF
jgi:outer membrane receptor for ferrienterochelin and colicin